jgi:hypothetical protein
VEARQMGDYDVDAAECACAIEYDKISKLNDKLARTAGTNIEELKLKARYANIQSTDRLVTVSIVRDLRALSPPRPPQIRP